MKNHETFYDQIIKFGEALIRLDEIKLYFSMDLFGWFQTDIITDLFKPYTL